MFLTACLIILCTICKVPQDEDEKKLRVLLPNLEIGHSAARNWSLSPRAVVNAIRERTPVLPHLSGGEVMACQKWAIITGSSIMNAYLANGCDLLLLLPLKVGKKWPCNDNSYDVSIYVKNNSGLNVLWLHAVFGCKYFLNVLECLFLCFVSGKA